MIGNFDPDTHNVYLFLENGDQSQLEEEMLDGELLDSGRPGHYPGTIELEYDDTQDDRRPHIERDPISEELTVGDLSITISDTVYHKLKDGHLYHDRVGSFQDLNEVGKVWIFPPETRGQYDYMWDDLHFYQDLTAEQRETYRENTK